MNIRPYQVSIVQQPQKPDFAKRVSYCNWFLTIAENKNILDITFFSDEAWFHLSGYTNTQNMHLWAVANPHAIHDHPLHDLKIGVWCAMSCTCVIGPIFFETTVNTDLYCKISDTFLNQLDDTELQHNYIVTEYFQQDGATCHTYKRSRFLVGSIFEDCIISKGIWPPSSPDLSPPDFFLWGMLKGKVYANEPRTIQQLKVNITAAIADVGRAQLAGTFASMERRVVGCLQEEGGGHFQHLLWCGVLDVSHGLCCLNCVGLPCALGL